MSNPGCYATGSQLGLGPLVSQSLVNGLPCIFGVSGYSGAGTKPSPKNDVNHLNNNLLPYSLVGHIHEREISSHLTNPVAFMPHVGQFFRGITLTIHVIPEVKSIAGEHGVEVGGFKLDPSGKRLVLVVTLDNLLKGAATQAIQNVNLALNLKETMGFVAS